MSDIPWTWFVMRSSGLVAVGLLTIAVVLGILGPLLRPTPRLTSISVHRAASIAGSVLIVGHIVLAVLDTWIVLDLAAAFVPGLAGWQRWGVALGALSVDLMIVVLLTTATRSHTPALWRRAHLLAYPVWALAVGHGLLVGSDGAVMRTVALVSAGLVLMALSTRLLVRPGNPARDRAHLSPAGALR